jgi:hypothetical protein
MLQCGFVPDVHDFLTKRQVTQDISTFQPLQTTIIKLFLFLRKLKRKSLTDGTQLQDFFFHLIVVLQILLVLFFLVKPASFTILMGHFPAKTKAFVDLI